MAKNWHLNDLLLFCKSTNTHLNVTFYWKLAQLLLGGIISEKPKNTLWRRFYYFDTRLPKPNEQPFLHFVILPPYFCSDLSLLTFYYVLMYFSYLYAAIFDDVMNFEFHLFP